MSDTHHLHSFYFDPEYDEPPEVVGTCACGGPLFDVDGTPTCGFAEHEPGWHADAVKLAAVTAERDELRAEATMLHRALVDVMDWVRDFDFRDAAMKTLEQNATYEELRAMGFSGRSAWVDAKLEPLYAALAAADAALADGREEGQDDG